MLVSGKSPLIDTIEEPLLDRQQLRRAAQHPRLGEMFDVMFIAVQHDIPGK
ncbi:Uncharacterised protein [Serratia fonticola]|nr:Uncharacterised protein [Serratia fonticola]